jgi:hypothetical protein
MDQTIQRSIGSLKNTIVDRVFKSFPLEDGSEEVCELYIENDFFEDCYDIWVAAAEDVAVRRLLRNYADTFYLGVVSLMRSAPNWFEILPIYMAELLENIFEKEEEDLYKAFEDLGDPS